MSISSHPGFRRSRFSLLGLGLDCQILYYLSIYLPGDLDALFLLWSWGDDAHYGTYRDRPQCPPVDAMLGIGGGSFFQCFFLSLMDRQR
ncbi:hypothetical protein K503DRAFT_200671 [Rhizopogon vinicolor AM-OR11-026]|uniref:Uncharacterized protein n=1 Tax=Rhizopogon vinicolor AM-OR11-026 TaxID=1314800 RepID=A0A1B7NEJ2_9AGAM|nr:hypothetical protein K503DRAFT_200671 [Rhizopogon vinicolor AM-OR11-026]